MTEKKDPTQPTLRALLQTVASAQACEVLFCGVRIPPEHATYSGESVSRALLSQALNLVLFQDLMDRVPNGRAYVEECMAAGRKVVFDHGALRTVALAGMGSLPAGHESIGRILEPLGYRIAGLYPLDRIGMTGLAYTHEDSPEDLPQFFVSELHPQRFSAKFQAAVARITETSRDPLTSAHSQLLAELRVAGELSLDKARQLLPALAFCFGRHHSTPALADYETLLAESAEMAWISTEGNAFNHATDRVSDLASVVAEQRRLARPLKDKIEVSGSGRVQQTAFRADLVTREFTGADGHIVTRNVPGSFYEFIQRELMKDEISGKRRLDLAFDSGNAQGIFKMTAAA